MVETAIVLPLFLTLIFGIIEFSYAVAQNNEVRQVSREATRELGVDPGADPVGLVCGGFALIDPTNVTVSLTSAGVVAGDSAELTVDATYQTLTGLFDPMFAGVVLETSHRFVVDQPFGGGSPGWATDFAGVACP